MCYNEQKPHHFYGRTRYEHSDFTLTKSIFLTRADRGCVRLSYYLSYSSRISLLFDQLAGVLLPGNGSVPGHMIFLFPVLSSPLTTWNRG